MAGQRASGILPSVCLQPHWTWHTQACLAFRVSARYPNSGSQACLARAFTKPPPCLSQGHLLQQKMEDPTRTGISRGVRHSVGVILTLTIRGHSITTSWTGTLGLGRFKASQYFQKKFRYLMILSLVNQTVCSKHEGSFKVLCGESHPYE